MSPVLKRPSTKPAPILKIPQARCMSALMPDDPDSHWSCWPLLTRVEMASRAGINPTTGTVNRVLHGIPPGSSSGDPHPGLLERGLLHLERIPEDGGSIGSTTVVYADYYRITEAGVTALRGYLLHHELPPVRDKSLCVNDRYQGGGNLEESGQGGVATIPTGG